MRIAHFSDIHVTASTSDIPWRAMFSKRIVGWLNLQLLGREEDFREAEEITAALVKDIQQVGADHILFTGDLTGLALDSEFERAHRLLAPILDSENITGIPGNHDFYVPAAAKDGTYDRHFGSWERSELANPPPIVRLLGEEAALIALRQLVERRALSMEELRAICDQVLPWIGPREEIVRPDGTMQSMREWIKELGQS